MTDPSYGTRAASSPAIPRRPFAVVVLAAGEGTRMKSTRPKVLHGFAGRSLLGHVLAACAPLDAERTIVVVGHHRDDVQAHLDLTRAAGHNRGPGRAARHRPRGADRHGSLAARGGRRHDRRGAGDTPLLQPTSLLALLTEHDRSGAAATMLTSVLDDPTGIRPSHSRWGPRHADRRAEGRYRRGARHPRVRGRHVRVRQRGAARRAPPLVDRQRSGRGVPARRRGDLGRRRPTRRGGGRTGERHARRQRSRPARRGSSDLQPSAARRPYAGRRDGGRPGDHLDRCRRAPCAGRDPAPIGLSARCHGRS